MKKNISFLFLLLLSSYAIKGIHRSDQRKNLQSFLHQQSSQQKIDKKPKFIPKRMTDAEKQRLSAYINKQLNAAQEVQNEQLINKYERLAALLEKLTSGELTTQSMKDEKAYTEYFNLVVAELESLGENPQIILQTTGLRQKLLEGKLEKTPWFVKEIEGLDWFFEQDAQQASFNAERMTSGLQPLGPTQPQWPKPKDKALYIVSLVDQIERNYQRIETEDLATIIETCQEYLISFLPDIPNVFKRTVQEALNKLEKVRNIRGIPSLKE